jgi:uncharacterized membrane protein YdfJ with MMPL/SSD domain
MSEMVENSEPVAKRNWLVPLIALVAVVALTVVALNREPVTLDPDTPEGTVQAYLQAISDEDYKTALSYMTVDLQQRCNPEDIADNVYYDSFSATLGEVEEVGSITVVEVSINQSDSGFNGGYFERIEVADEEGEFAVSGDPWPYFTYSCDNQ